MTIGSDDDFKPTTAVEWLVALSEQPADAGLRADFEAWLAQDSRHAQDWAEVTHLDGLLKTSGSEKVVAMADRRRSRRIAVAAVAAIAAAVAVIAGPSVVLRLQADYVAPSSGITVIPLADGSHLHLAPASAVSVALSSGERRVKLLKGEAFFDVAPDANRPFRVAAAAAQVTVLGTAFDVKAEASATTVAVRHGLVQVEAAGIQDDAVRLLAGDVVRISASGDMARIQIPPEQAGAWARGQLIVRERPVLEVIAEIRRYYAGWIILRDEDLNGRLVTGIYDLRQPEEAVDVIAAVHGATVRKYGPVLLITK